MVFLLLLFPFVSHSQDGPFYITDNNIQREFHFHIPKNLPPQSPLVYDFHGWGGNGSSIMSTTNFNALADQNNFAVCYPSGLEDGSGLTLWDVEGLSDINFILSLNDTLQEAYQFDTTRFFATGFSFGAEMSYHIANCQTTNTFAAIAPVGGTMWDYSANGWPIVCTPSNDISVFVLHGTNDEDFDFDGGNYPDEGAYLSIPSIVSYWSDYNSCTYTDDYTLPDLNNDNNLTEVTKYCNVNTGHKVWLYKVNNGQHEWFDESPSGDHDFWASEAIWNFFSQVSCTTTGIDELTPINNRKLVKTVNLLGQEIRPQPNTLLVHMYDDGTVVKKIIFE